MDEKGGRRKGCVDQSCKRGLAFLASVSMHMVSLSLALLSMLVLVVEALADWGVAITDGRERAVTLTLAITEDDDSVLGSTKEVDVSVLVDKRRV